jgi:hypothetical protein
MIRRWRWQQAGNNRLVSALIDSTSLYWNSTKNQILEMRHAKTTFNNTALYAMALAMDTVPMTVAKGVGGGRWIKGRAELGDSPTLLHYTGLIVFLFFF